MNGLLRVVLALVFAGCARDAAAPRTASPTQALGPAEPQALEVRTNVPCTGDAEPLKASAIYTRFEAQSWASMAADDEPVPPAEAFGTCTVDRGVIRSAEGHLVAELGCGVRIVVGGIRDELGLEIGAMGRDVLVRKPAPRPRLTCRGNGPDHAWCRFDRPDGGDTDGTAYVVAGSFKGDTLVGPAAEQWIADRAITEIFYSVWCH